HLLGHGFGGFVKEVRNFLALVVIPYFAAEQNYAARFGVMGLCPKGVDINFIGTKMFHGYPPLLGGITSTTSPGRRGRSEEHTSELQSRENLVCRLLTEKKN